MTNNKPLLEILIGTYNRPLRAINAIKSCLEINDERLIVSCSSNGKEESLEFLQFYDKRLSYTYFLENKGPLINWYTLIENSKAQFVMLLSDEDTLNQKYVGPFLDWLFENKDELSVVNSGIIDSENFKFYYKPIPNLKEIKVRDLLLRYPEQTSYISGYVYNRELIGKIDLKLIFNDSKGNVYPHINLCNSLQNYGKHLLYENPVIIKGKDDKIGGHAYEHVNDDLNNQNNLLNYNVYGSYARARQFYYTINAIRRDIPNRRTYEYFLYDFQNCLDFYFGIYKSNVLTGASDCYYSSVKKACNDSRISNEYIESFYSKIFLYLFKYDIYKIMRIVQKVVQLTKRLI